MTKLGLRAESAAKCSGSLEGNAVTQFRFPNDAASPIDNSSSPLTLVRWPIRAHGPIRSFETEITERPIFAVGSISYPKKTRNAFRRSLHGNAISKSWTRMEIIELLCGRWVP